MNPGLFAEYEETICRHWSFRSGGRLDFVQTDIVEDPATLDNIGLEPLPLTYAQVVGTDESQEEFLMWSLYAGLDHQITNRLVASASLGYAERPPNLTELYAAGPFILVLQNGLNTVTGDPRLDQEKLVQFDVTLDYRSNRINTGVRGFYGWALDYITFENTSVRRTGGVVEQVNLRYVNTDLATLTGFESFAELFPNSQLTPFATMRYVDGRDRTRNGDFATFEAVPGLPGQPSYRDPDRVRGGGNAFPIPASDSEPLPGIAPFETRLGIRLRDSIEATRWSLELSARVVDNQDRVATSLLESPTAGFTVWDIRGSYRPDRFNGVTVISGVENFTDKQYREHLDFRSPSGFSVFQPGASFYLGADVSY